eukprot:s1702_g9.t1
MPSSTRLLRFRKEHLKLRLQNPRGNFVLHFKVHDRTVNDENLGRMRAITAHCDVSFQERLHQRCVTDIAAAATTTLLAPLPVPVPVPLPAIAALERSCRGLPYTLFRCHALYGYRLPADRREQSSQGRWQSSRRAAGLVEGREEEVLCVRYTSLLRIAQGQHAGPATALTAEEARETLRGFLENLQSPLPSNARIYYNQQCHAWHAVVNRKNVKDSYQSLSKHKTHAAALQATVAALRNQGRPSADQATQAAVPCVADEPVPDGSSAGRFAELVQLAENETPVAEAGGVSGVAVVPVPDANAAGDLLQYAQPPANEKRQIEARSASSPSTAAVSQTVPGISLEHPPAQTVQASPILTPSVEAAGDVRGSLNSASAPALGMRVHGNSDEPVGHG